MSEQANGWGKKAGSILTNMSRYLWASLQLETIFPANSNTVITDDHILNLINHLPRDLPEAFERALGGITDRRYEGKIMKLVMAALTPLNLDEIRVALSIAVGEPIWHPENIAKHGAQLISLCGGNLLEVDEEDAKVRFIHHSIIQHLLSPAANQSTTPYHFTAEDAENFIGATCVTYLHLPVLDSRITVKRNLQGHDILENVIERTEQASPVVRRWVEHIRSRDHRRARSSDFDIARILSQIQAVRIQEDLDPHCFEHYAESHWVFHTRFFDERLQDCKNSWKLWWRLLNGGVDRVKPPCTDLKENPYTTLTWAIEHAHGSLFRTVLSECGLLRHQVALIVRALELHKSIHGLWLGNILVQYIQSLHSIDMPSTANTINFLLSQGADPNAAHSILKASPIDILTQRICTDSLPAEDELELIRRFLSHAAVERSLADQSVLIALENLLKGAKLVAIAELLQWRPDLVFRVNEIQAEGLCLGTAIMEAFDNGRWEELKILAIPGLVNKLTVSGTSLLWKAIESKSDHWIYHLLSVGADPNIGPFDLIQRIGSPSFVATCYPLEAAMWLRSTRVCLELLHHGAKISLLKSPFRFNKETGKMTFSAKMLKILGQFEWQEQPDHQRHHEHDGTVLVKACKMLSHDDSSNPVGPSSPLGLSTPLSPSKPLGISRNLRIFNSNGGWVEDLATIIYQLALDGDAEYLNTPNEEGKTAMHQLAKAKNTSSPMFGSLVNLLLSRGANPNLTDHHMETPLCSAISNNMPIDSVIEPILKAGADPNAKCLLHRSSMMQRVMEGYWEISRSRLRLVRLLLQAGADPRDPMDLTSTDPSLVASARRYRLERLVANFNEYTDKLNGRATE